jgi:hypothetical protein
VVIIVDAGMVSSERVFCVRSPWKAEVRFPVCRVLLADNFVGRNKSAIVTRHHWFRITFAKGTDVLGRGVGAGVRGYFATVHSDDRGVILTADPLESTKRLEMDKY